MAFLKVNTNKEIGQCIKPTNKYLKLDYLMLITNYTNKFEKSLQLSRLMWYIVNPAARWYGKRNDLKHFKKVNEKKACN
ncbi:hypothetical protein BK127_42070 [Paenibacillus sp. FSL H7-0331]|nr:hypothetical protein BK127_42070 [Paenibacillus sp. FSL H7-0331]